MGEDTQDYVLGNSQPSPFDKLRAGSAGLDHVCQSYPGLTSWATLSRPRSTSSGQALRG
jgi:hypothetical protein